MKKLSAFFVMLMLVFAAGVCVHAADQLEIITNSTLSTATVNTYYETDIQAVGGTEPYTFTLLNPIYVPNGFTLSEQGKFSGTPTVGGLTYADIEIGVTDAEGNTAEKTFSLAIYALRVTFQIGENNFTFDNLPHTVSAVPYVNGSDASSFIDYTITYNGESSQTNAGTYPINIVVTTPGYMFRSMDKTHMYINENENVNISFANLSFEYNGTPRTPDISVKGRTSESSQETDLSYTVLYEGIDVSYSSSNAPVNPGVYRVSCTVDDSNYATPAQNSATFEILHNTVDFTLNDTSDFYFGDTWSRNYISSDAAITDYTVKYVKDGVEYDKPEEIGTYTVKITLNDSSIYEVGTISPATVTVKNKPVNFTITDNKHTYDGNGHTATVTPSIEGVGYSVTYTNSKGVAVTSPTDAGTYTIGITFDNPNAYSLGTITPNTLVIDPQTVGFTVSDNEMSYDGDPHQATVTPNITISSDAYTVKYRDSKGNLKDSVTNVGVYDIVITVSDTNYVLDSNFSGTMTITSAVSLNIGNSPAAMIYKDSTHADDTEWQAAALNELQTDHKFTSHVPSGCSADITYNLINNIDVDSDKNTVIVKSLDTFSDPGLSVNGTTVSGGTPVQVDGVEGLYKVTYTYEDQSYERYVAVVGRIGDVNGDGNVNAIDANYLNGTNAAPSGVTQARVWDVNKDGNIDGSDASAIRNRFKTKLTSYYPWI